MTNLPFDATKAIDSEGSSVTLYSPPASARRPRPARLTIPESLSPFINRLTPTTLRTSIADNRASIQTFLSAASIAFSDRKDSPLLANLSAQDSPSPVRMPD